LLAVSSGRCIDKFKPASIPLSSSGTITPSPSASSSDVVVHLEGSSSSDVHGFSGKVEKDAGGGEMREVLLVWEEDEQVSSTQGDQSSLEGCGSLEGWRRRVCPLV
jgi:hypothetical protein